MSVATELAKQAHRLEYVLAIEGIGWPDDVSDLDGDWDGTVFATADLEFDMASTLGCTVKKILQPPGGFSESYDPEGYTFQAGGMSFDLVNSDDTLSTFFRAHRRTTASGSQQMGKVYSGNVLDFNQTTLRIQWTNPGGTVDPAEEGDVVWLGGSEAVLLGARTSLGSDAYSYASCTRGYLGTPRGSEDRTDYSGTVYGSEYKIGTEVYPWNPYWQGRRTLLCARVPGTDQLSTFAHGIINKVSRKSHGTLWSIDTSARTAPLRMRRKPVVGGLLTAKAQATGTEAGEFSFASQFFAQGSGNVSSAEKVAALKKYRLVDLNAAGGAPRTIPFVYSYRTVAGGTKGAYDLNLTTTPQAETEPFETQHGHDSTRYMSMRPAVIGGNFTRIMFKTENAGTATAKSDRVVVLSSITTFNGRAWKDIEPGADVRVCIDNYSDKPIYNPFAVNNKKTNNPINFCLTLLTSRDGEFYRADAAASGTTTTVNFTAPSWTTDQWSGYALHCVEGDNKGEARLILSNDSDTLTVSPAFTADTHSGNEYQIRNSIYDTLPWGFGMQVHNSEIDIASWERLRDVFGESWKIGTVLIGAEEDEDLWDLMQSQVFRVFGVVTYVDRATGKLTPRYVGDTYEDGVVQTYPSIDNDEIQPGSLETVDLTPRTDITAINLRYRGSYVVAAAPVWGRVNSLASTGAAEYGIIKWRPLALAQDVTGDAEESTYRAVLPELSRVLRGTGREVTIEAMLCGEAQAPMLRDLMDQRLFHIAVAPPQGDLTVDIRHLLELYAGAIVKVDAQNLGITDPYTGNAMDTQLCRILSMDVSLWPRAVVRLVVQLLGNTGPSVGLLAPSATVTSKGTSPDDHFAVDVTVFTEGASDGTLDWDEFAVGDLIELRDTTGALKEGPKTIASFGANEASTPAAASSYIINVTTSISATIATDDYVTLAPWSASNTTNMNRFCAYADATDEELGTGDAPKVWG